MELAPQLQKRSGTEITFLEEEPVALARLLAFSAVFVTFHKGNGVDEVGCNPLTVDQDTFASFFKGQQSAHLWHQIASWGVAG